MPLIPNQKNKNIDFVKLFCLKKQTYHRTGACKRNEKKKPIILIFYLHVIIEMARYLKVYNCSKLHNILLAISCSTSGALAMFKTTPLTYFTSPTSKISLNKIKKYKYRFSISHKFNKHLGIIFLYHSYVKHLKLIISN